jgi:hypothetical protein
MIELLSPKLREARWTGPPARRSFDECQRSVNVRSSILQRSLIERSRSPRNRHGSAQHRTRELLRGHGFREQRALHQIKTHLTHGLVPGPSLHAPSDGAGAEAIGKIKDFATCRLFQPVFDAAGDEFPFDLDFYEGKIIEANQRRLFRANIVNR